MSEAGYPSIGSYALIGDGRTAALVSDAGSVDWLCLPQFDSPSVFGALLDARQGGRFAVAPVEAATTTRRYVGETNVLETTFRTEHGVLRLTDAMPIPEELHRKRELLPDHEIVRRVECLEGEVDVQVVFDPRPDYARQTPRLRFDRALRAYICPAGPLILALQSDITLGDDGAAGLRGRATLRAGERRYLSLTAEAGPAIVAGLGEEAERRLEGTRQWWEQWAAGCEYDGEYRDAVLRSVLMLRLLVFSPSGAIVAAPTTSLPEAIGQGRNWDYRFCWLRDSTMTLRALFDLGITDEGEEFLGWMLDATRLTWPRLQVLYTVHGGTHVAEKTLAHLDGFRGSKPVRTGNGASDQLQLDIYGEVTAAALDYVDRGGRLDYAEGRMLRGLGDSICDLWNEPDNGIWEVRAGRVHHVLSKALCWVGLDALLQLDERDALHVKVDVERYRRERDRIHEVVESRGWNEKLGSYTATLDGDDVDASLLLLPLYGYAAGDGRTARTSERIHERLSRDGLLYRYRGDDGLAGAEGAFGICSFWAVDVLARLGRVDEARATFDHILGFANDVGLFAEEIDPRTGEALGNFPQAFTHVGLVNAAMALTKVARNERPTQISDRTAPKKKVRTKRLQ